MPVITALLSISLTAAAAEMLPFVWDQGAERDRADRGDVILDVSRACNSDDIAINLPGLLEHPLPVLPAPDPENTRQRLAQAGIELNPPGLASLVNVFDHNLDQAGPLFVLLPESHISIGGQAEERRHDLLHFMNAFVAVGLIEATPGPILNLREGLANTPPRREFALEGTNRFSQLLNQVERVHGMAFTNLALLYQDETRVHSSYLEKGSAMATQILLAFGEMDSAQTFADALANVKRNYRTDIDRVMDLAPAYERLSKLDHVARTLVLNLLCVTRGEQMAERAIEMAREKQAALVFVGYGASHHAEIAAALRKAHKRFVALQPRLPPPDQP